MVTEREALEACVAWFYAEHEMPHSTTFQERVSLCNYCEWCCEQALSLSSSEFVGSPHFVWPGLLHRDTVEEMRRLVKRMMDSYKADRARKAADDGE